MTSDPLTSFSRVLSIEIFDHMTMNSEDLQMLVEGLKSLQGESEWVEFKLNYDNPEEIGEYISALSNSAALWAQPRGYLVWGIDDKS